MTWDAGAGREAWDNLLGLARKTHLSHPQLSAFCPFPDDITAQAVEAFDIPAAQLMAQEEGLFTAGFADFRDAFLACGPMARWRETYKETNIGQDFMDRFACYCLIGQGGAFHSEHIASWVVFMPPHLHYTWHHHPGEEMYLVLAGEAEFLRKGADPVMLGPGGTSFHASNQPHAMETYDAPVMAYVTWRNGFDSPPVLTQ